MTDWTTRTVNVFCKGQTDMGLYKTTQDRLAEVGRLATLGLDATVHRSESWKNVQAWIEAREYEKALTAIEQMPPSDETLNARAVLLMRRGQHVSAANALRPRIFDTKTGVIREDASPLMLGNLASALFLCGKVGGAVQLLRRLPPAWPEAEKLADSIQQWERHLSWWQWLDWKINGVEHGTQFPFAGDPGTFPWEVMRDAPATRTGQRDESSGYDLAV